VRPTYNEHRSDNNGELGEHVAKVVRELEYGSVRVRMERESSGLYTVVLQLCPQGISNKGRRSWNCGVVEPLGMTT
jgi:hypothetical protein